VILERLIGKLIHNTDTAPAKTEGQ